MTELIFLACIGLASGLLGGMLGIGGGVILVPALIFLYEAQGTLPQHAITLVAVGTSMSIIVLTSLSAAYTQYRAQKILWQVFAKMLPAFVIGSLCAGLVTPFVQADSLRIMIGCFLLTVSIIMLTRWSPKPHQQLPKPAVLGGIGLIGGVASGTAGIAGGNIIVPTLVYFNTPVHNATATSSAMGVAIALAGAFGYAVGVQAPAESQWMIGYIDTKTWFVVTIAAVCSAPIGVKLAHRVPAGTLKRVFGALLGVAALRMIYTGIGY